MFSIAHRTICEALVLQPSRLCSERTDVLLCGVPVHSGTAPFSAGPYTCDMQLESIEATIVTVSGSDLSACVHKVLRFWPGVASFRRSSDVAVNNPRRTMSETIQQVIR
jgi:hypothetical protein